MMTVKDVSKLAGVSIRTLRYYDRIGLLPAAAYSEAGYRLYDGAALERLQQILLFRALQFPLKDIQRILSSPDYDRRKALAQQIELLTMQKAHIEKLLALAREIEATGGTYMDFSAFDKSQLESYAQQAKAQWGQTSAYAEFAEKSAHRPADTEAALGQGLMAILAELGAVRPAAPDSPEAQALVAKLQDYITAHYYRCTKPILRSLGQMYACDSAFQENIDAAGGAGTARFASQAIAVYCGD